MKVLIATCVSLFVLLSACGGREMVADCSYMGQGSTYCRAPDDTRSEGGYCCPSSHPYCGTPNTNCPVGDCCNAPPQ